MTDTTTTTQVTTPTGKTLADFRIPAKLTQNDPALIDLIMKSESMKDEERQYWFNLYEVMNTAQIDKLRDILTRERAKLAEIDAKYGKKPKIDPFSTLKVICFTACKPPKDRDKSFVSIVLCSINSPLFHFL